MGCGESRSTSSKPATSNQTAIVRISSILEKYNLGKPISKNQFAETYSASNKETNDKRSVIGIKKTSINNLELFFREYARIQQLDHPNIVRVFEIFDEPACEFIYIVSQTLTGKSLEQTYSTSCFQDYKILQIYILSIFKALTYMQFGGVVHRQISLANIYLEKTTGEEVIMLTNFSLAHFAKPELNYNGLKENPIFFAPEVHKSQKFTVKSDVWSAGMVSFLILTGDTPYKLEIPENNKKPDYAKLVVSIHITKELLSKYTSLRPDAVTFFLKCLDYDEVSRYNADELLKLPFFLVKDLGVLTDDAKQNISKNLKGFARSNKIEKEIFRFLTFNHELDKDERKLREFFKAADTSQDGKLSKEELIAALDKNNLVLPISKQEFEQAFDEADTNKSGALTYSEFITLFMNKERLLTDENIKAAFKDMDKDGSGYLTKEDFVGIPGMEAIIQEIDQSKDGKISLTELIQFIKEKKNKDGN